MARLTPAQKRKRAAMHRLNPFPLAREATVQGARLDENPNRGKRDASPLNWAHRTIAHDTIRQPVAALVVSHPLRTPTGRIARKGGAPLYSSYTIGSKHPMPVRNRESEDVRDS